MNYLSSRGPAAKAIEKLGWGMSAVSIFTVVLIAGLLLWAILRRRDAEPVTSGASVERTGNGLKAIYVGTIISTVVLFALAIWMVAVTAAVVAPGRATAFTIQVIGHQWWWELRYLDRHRKQSFITANEIRIPTGAPVKLELMSADVIHSFWVPKLAGKMDAVPGQLNETWIEASAPGEYRGQCAEYCGLQHANMTIVVLAQAKGEFQAWWDGQMTSPAPATGQLGSEGQQLFVHACGRCHAVNRTAAAGHLGPDLTHVMQRKKIGSNMYPNTPGHLGGWIADAPTLKPGVFMPAMTSALTGDELVKVLDYVQTLR